jgi:hypothetical protein
MIRPEGELLRLNVTTMPIFPEKCLCDSADNFGACPHSHYCPVKITKRKARLERDWNKPRIEARGRMFAEDSETWLFNDGKASQPSE